MRTRFYKWAGILIVLLALSPGVVRAQDSTGYSPPAYTTPFPIASTRMEEGVFTYATFAFFRQSIPLDDDVVALRGFVDSLGQFSAGGIGQQITEGQVALDTGMVDGPTNYQPGFRIGIGYRFRDGSVLEASWLHLQQSKYTAVATLVPAFQLGGNGLVNTFLSAPVYNYPTDFSGPADDLSFGLPGGAYGIWNAAEAMTLVFRQRNERIEMRYRIPMFETECWRTYGMMGPRFNWFWETFRWRTEDQDNAGVLDPANVAIYYNTVSNRMYGIFIGVGNEWYMGNGLAVSLDLEATGYLNVVHSEASYRRGDRFTGPGNKRSRIDYTIVPEIRSNFNLHWYPIEGVQMKIGYDIMAFFNTVASPHPIDFNYGGLTPQYDRKARLLDGFEVGLSISF